MPQYRIIDKYYIIQSDIKFTVDLNSSLSSINKLLDEMIMHKTFCIVIIDNKTIDCLNPIMNILTNKFKKCDNIVKLFAESIALRNKLIRYFENKRTQIIYKYIDEETPLLSDY